jgi:hypothetical protein
MLAVPFTSGCFRHLVSCVHIFTAFYINNAGLMSGPLTEVTKCRMY